MMIAVTFHGKTGRVSHSQVVPQFITLRDLQEGLCKLFDRNFPSTQANVEVEGRKYDEFDHTPFANCNPPSPCDAQGVFTSEGKVEALVTFERNTCDPFCFAWADRWELKRRFPHEAVAEDAARPSEMSTQIGALMRQWHARGPELPTEINLSG